MIKGLRTMIYPAPNLEETRLWYSKVLGIEPYFDQPFYVGFNVGGYELGLDPAAKVFQTPSGQIAYWGVEDIEKVYQYLLELGAREHTPIKDVGDGIKVATVLDPFGNTFGVIDNPHFNAE